MPSPARARTDRSRRSPSARSQVPSAPHNQRASRAARGRGRRPSSPRRDRRLLRLTPRLAATTLVLLLILLGGRALGPYADYTAARDRVSDLTGERVELTEAVQALESEQARLQDPRELEEEARSELGLTRPGEIPYIVVNPPTEPPAPSMATDVADEADPPIIQRIIDVVTEWLN